MSESVTIFWLRASEWFLLLSGVSLVVGLIGEYRLRFWDTRLKVFEVLVLIGCGGELIADAGVFLFSEHLQAIQHLSVESLKKLADEADEKAIEAIGDAKKASDIAKPAKETADEAKGEAEVAKDKAEAVSVETGTLTGQLSAAKQDLAGAKQELANAEAAEQKEEQTLSDMAVCLAPRVIPEEGIFNPTTKTEAWSTLGPVRPFSELQAIIDVVPDAEARRAASSIEIRLHDAGWKRVTVLQGVNGLRDGVEIIPWSPREFGNKELGTPEGDARLRRNLELHGAVSKAADAIVDWLHSFNWYVTRGQEPNPDISPDAVEIKVGLYPPVELIPSPGEKPFAELDAEMQKSREEARVRAEHEQDEKVEEQYKTYPPDMAARARAEWKQMREDEKKMDERYFSQPCRSINPFDPALPVH